MIHSIYFLSKSSSSVHCAKVKTRSLLSSLDWQGRKSWNSFGILQLPLLITLAFFEIFWLNRLSVFMMMVFQAMMTVQQRFWLPCVSSLPFHLCFQRTGQFFEGCDYFHKKQICRIDFFGILVNVLWRVLIHYFYPNNLKLLPTPWIDLVLRLSTNSYLWAKDSNLFLIQSTVSETHFRKNCLSWICSAKNSTFEALSL